MTARSARCQARSSGSSSDCSRNSWPGTVRIWGSGGKGSRQRGEPRTLRGRASSGHPVHSVPQIFGAARDSTYVQDVAAAGQVAPVSQGRPAQVHAAFRPASSRRLAMTGETEAESVSSRLPSGVVAVSCFRLPLPSPPFPSLPPPSVDPRCKPVTPKPLLLPLADAHPALGRRRLRRPLSVEHKAVTSQHHPSRAPVLPVGEGKSRSS